MTWSVACLAQYLLAELSSGYTPRPMMLIVGAEDASFPYNAGYSFTTPPIRNPGAEENLAAWGGHNGCPGDTATESVRDNYTLHEIDCNGVVSALVELPGVGHWPFYYLTGGRYDQCASTMRASRPMGPAPRSTRPSSLGTLSRQRPLTDAQLAASPSTRPAAQAAHFGAHARGR